MVVLYLSPVETIAATPAWTGTWTNNSGIRRKMRLDRFGSTPLISMTKTKAVTTNPTNSGICQFSSDPLPAAGSLPSGTSFLLQGVMWETASGDDAMMRVVISIYSGDGTTLRGTAFAGPGDASVAGSGNVNNRELPVGANLAAITVPRSVQATTTSTVVYQKGDILVAEVGARFVQATSTGTAGAAFTTREDCFATQGRTPLDLTIDKNHFVPFLKVFDPNLFTVVLGIEEYQFGTAGRVLNSNTTIPFIDLTSVDGLDNAQVRVSQADREGVHGAYVTAEFETSRTVTLEGTLYASPSALDAELDALKANFAPSRQPKPLYFGADDGSTRHVMGNSLGLRYSKNRDRSTGKVNFQVQIVCSDPRIYKGQEISTLVGASATTIVVPGSRETPAIVTMRASVSVANTPSFTVTNAQGQYTFFWTGSLSNSSDDFIVLDLNARTILLGGVTNIRNQITVTGGWPYLMPGPNEVVNSSFLSTTFEYKEALA